MRVFVNGIVRVPHQEVTGGLPSGVAVGVDTVVDDDDDDGADMLKGERQNKRSANLVI